MPILSGNWYVCNNTEKESECCEHDGCNNTAVEKMAGEVDSFGVEWWYYCKEHADEEKAIDSVEVIDCCEYCKNEKSLRPYRDPDEGFCGPQHWICNACYQSEMKRFDDEYYNDL